MTTRELIEHLSKLPQDLDVRILDAGYLLGIGCEPSTDVENGGKTHMASGVSFTTYVSLNKANCNIICTE